MLAMETFHLAAHHILFPNALAFKPYEAICNTWFLLVLLSWLSPSGPAWGSSLKWKPTMSGPRGLPILGTSLSCAASHISALLTWHKPAQFVIKLILGGWLWKLVTCWLLIRDGLNVTCFVTWKWMIVCYCWLIILLLAYHYGCGGLINRFFPLR